MRRTALRNLLRTRPTGGRPARRALVAASVIWDQLIGTRIRGAPGAPRFSAVAAQG